MGRAVVRRLVAAGHMVRVAVRAVPSTASPNNWVSVGEIGPLTMWESALSGIEAIVHLAARVHVMRERGDRTDAYQQVNTVGTLRLARAASACGVRRFVFVSSIKVSGESTEGRPFRAGDPPAPADAYAMSKLAAERGLLDIEGLDPVILRPPLVYGAGAKGNLARLCRLASFGLPMPFGAIRNRRDMMGLENLADLIATCIVHPSAIGRVLLASDGVPLSTPELYGMIAHSMGRKARLMAVPVELMRALAKPLGLVGEVDRLAQSLEIDSNPTCELLGWTPPHSVQSGIAEMVRAYVAETM